MARAGGSASGKSGLGTAFHDGGVAPVGESDLADLRDSFHFDPARAEIRLGKRRMLLVDDIVLGQLRRELVRALGYESARMLMSRIGFGTGVGGAQVGRALWDPASRGWARDFTMAGSRRWARSTLPIGETASTSTRRGRKSAWASGGCCWSTTSCLASCGGNWCALLVMKARAC